LHISDVEHVLAELVGHLDLRNAIHVGHSTGGGEVALIEAAHRTCPYSKVSRGNIDLLITLVGPARSTTIIFETVSLERKI
jgi:organic hydroperoxide reductase OsmC/OhrA